jgi:hypothetical protein
MSILSDIASQRLQATSTLPSGVLMRWTHEPIALYQRNKQGTLYYIWPFLPCSAFTVLYFGHFTLGMNKTFPFWLLPLIALVAGIVIICVRLLPSDQWIELTEEGVNQRLQMPGGGGYFFSWAYKDVEHFSVSRDSQTGVRYSVLKFSVKNEHKPKIVIVPEAVSLDSVLQILDAHNIRQTVA